jgi:threonine/homoserine/homoserine lactone efflux protein
MFTSVFSHPIREQVRRPVAAHLRCQAGRSTGDNKRMLLHFAAFLGISAVVIVLPGQDTALVIRNTLFGGRRSGVFTAIGVVTALAVWAVATSAGVAALLRASEPAFVALKLLGATYLVFLGTQALRSALMTSAAKGATIDKGEARRLAPRVGLRQGVISNLGNPKIAVFFTSLLPQFAPHGQASFISLLLLGLIFCALTLAWLTIYAVAVSRAERFLRRSRIRRTMDGLTGAVLLGFGLRLATEQR